MSSEFAETFQNALADLLAHEVPGFLSEFTGEEDDPEVTRTSTYKNAGMLTMDNGIVVELENGQSVFLRITTRSTY